MTPVDENCKKFLRKYCSEDYTVNAQFGKKEWAWKHFVSCRTISTDAMKGRYKIPSALQPIVNRESSNFFCVPCLKQGKIRKVVWQPELYGIMEDHLKRHHEDITPHPTRENYIRQLRAFPADEAVNVIKAVGAYAALAKFIKCHSLNIVAKNDTLLSARDRDFKQTLLQLPSFTAVAIRMFGDFRLHSSETSSLLNVLSVAQARHNRGSPDIVAPSIESQSCHFKIPVGHAFHQSCQCKPKGPLGHRLHFFCKSETIQPLKTIRMN